MNFLVVLNQNNSTAPSPIAHVGDQRRHLARVAAAEARAVEASAREERERLV